MRPFERQMSEAGMRLAPGETLKHVRVSFVWDLYRRERDRRAARAERGETLLPVRDWDDQPWTLDSAYAALTASGSCDCAICVVYGGDCASSMRAEQSAPERYRMLRRIRRAKSRL